MDNVAVIVVLAVVLVLAFIGVIFISWTSRKSPLLYKAKYQAKWLAIENAVDKDMPASWHVAVMDADKLLDQALRDRRFGGKTMGERMKAAGKAWSNANHVWSAHKIRNQLAHESDYKLSYDVTRRALVAFRQALKDLGAI